MTRSRTKGLALALAVSVLAIGCATRKYVRTELESAEGRMAEKVDDVQSQVETNQSDIAGQKAQLEEQERLLAEASGTARDALDRAVAAGELAEGKFLFETVLSDDKVRFAFDESELSEDARAALDAFAEEIKVRNENVYVEIQGHTDSIGTEAYNERLGQSRAEAVRNYLSTTHHFALHRMSVISYGESAPVADNGNRQGRAQNRRVSLVVLK